MRAYVSLRGSRSPRSVERDADHGKHDPYASLVITGADHKTTRFELQYRVAGAGREDERIYVDLSMQRDGERRRVIHVQEVPSGLAAD